MLLVHLNQVADVRNAIVEVRLSFERKVRILNEFDDVLHVVSLLAEEFVVKKLNDQTKLIAEGCGSDVIDVTVITNKDAAIADSRVYLRPFLLESRHNLNYICHFTISFNYITNLIILRMMENIILI
jgi:hypothetical protein